MSQKDKILNLLLDRFPGYATNFEMNDICFRYGGRLKDLRNEGWEIANEQVKENPQEWRAKLLKPYNPKKQLPNLSDIPKVEIFKQKQLGLSI